MSRFLGLNYSNIFKFFAQKKIEFVTDIYLESIRIKQQI